MSDDSEQPCLKAKPRSKVTQWLVAISAIVAVVGLFQAYFILDTDTSYVPSSPSYDEPIISSDASVNSRIDERREIRREELRREELEILREAWRIDSLEAESDGVDYMIATAPAAAIALNDALSVTELVDYLSTASAAYNRISELWYKKKRQLFFVWT